MLFSRAHIQTPDVIIQGRHQVKGNKTWAQHSVATTVCFSEHTTWSFSEHVVLHWARLESQITLHTATYCNAVQHTATHCNALQVTAAHRCALLCTATHCYALQHIVAHCNALQHRPRMSFVFTFLRHSCQVRDLATHCDALHRTVTHRNTPRRTATHCNVLPCTASDFFWVVLAKFKVLPVLRKNGF